MRYRDETRAEFIDRIKREKGVGTVKVVKPITSREAARALEGVREDSSALLADMIARCHARFDKDASFGPAEKWGYEFEAVARDRAARGRVA